MRAQANEGCRRRYRKRRPRCATSEVQTEEQIRQAESNVARRGGPAGCGCRRSREGPAQLRAHEKSFDARSWRRRSELDAARTAVSGRRSATSTRSRRQVEAQHAAVALARSNAEQIAVRQSQVHVQPSIMQAAAARAARRRPTFASTYTEIKAPIDGIVDVARPRASARCVNAGTADRHADQSRRSLGARRRRGDATSIACRSATTSRSGCRPASSVTGVVFYRGVDAPFATQRDVSRTKRDIKTFEIRLRCDNSDRRLAVGMTAYVMLPAAVNHGRHRRPSSIVKQFGDFTAVNGISFTVEDGEIFGLLGPNGAGKSTLIRMLTTLLPPTSGTALVNGFDVVKQADGVRRSIGVIPQAMTSDLELSVEENLLIFAKLYGVPRDKRKRLIDELLDGRRADAVAFDKPVKNLSGGMRRRVEIARGLVHEPRDLLSRRADDGSRSGVARGASGRCSGRSSRSATSPSCITTHYMDEADKLCDRIAIVDHGELKALDSPMTLKASIPGKNTLEGELREMPAGWVSERCGRCRASRR